MKKILIVDSRIDKEEKNNLISLGYNVLLCPICKDLYEAVCGHPDMLIHILSSRRIICHNTMPLSFINKLKSLGFEIILSSLSLKSKYPHDIILNAVDTKDVFVHFLKYTDKNLLRNIKNKKIINVKQGYTKCSTAVINSSTFITSDKGIYNALTRENFDVLLLPPGDIILPGLNYGFIGGTCGLIDKNVLAFYGSLDYYKYGNEVKNFLSKHNIKPVYLRNGPLVDRGSIFRLS